MKKRIMPILCGSLFLALLLGGFFPAAAQDVPTISVSNGVIAELGATTTVSITLDEAPNGLSGYVITVSLSDPSKGEIMALEFPSWASLISEHSVLPADSFWIKALVLPDSPILAGATNVDFGTVTIRGDAIGECAINVLVTQLDDSNGYPFVATVSPGSLSVGLSDPETAAVFRVVSDGDVCADGTFYASGFLSGSADIAEWVNVSEPVEPGDVLELDPENPGKYRKARSECLSLVAGVVSTQPGFTLGGETEGSRAIMALIGIVPVKACDEGGPIELGDLLIPASIPGTVRRWNPETDTWCPFVGKALAALEQGEGLILALLIR